MDNIVKKPLSRRGFLGVMGMAGASAAAASMAGCSVGSSSSSSSSSTSTSADTSVLDNKDTITLTVFSETANFSGAQAGWGATLLKDLFNVELNIIPDTNGAYDTRMQSGDLGDIVIFGTKGDDYQDAIKAGLLFNWEDEDLVKNYGPDIMSTLDDAIEANRELNGDGHIYGISNDITNKTGQRDTFFYEWGLRWDLYAQAGYPEITDWDSLVTALGLMQKLAPTGDTGNTTYALSAWPDWDSNMVMYVKALASGYYGYDELGLGLYDSSNGTFHGALEENGPYMEALQFCNKLYRAGLLDPDSMTQTYDEALAKGRTGDTLFSLFDYAGSLLFNTEAHAGQDKFFGSLAPSDAHTIVYGLAPCGQTRMWSIGAKTMYPEKCMQIINWLCTPTGAMAIWYGIQGLMWDYDDSKKTYFTDLGKKCASDATTDLKGTTWQSPYSSNSYDLSGTFNDGLLQMNNRTWAYGATNPDSDGDRFNKVTWASNKTDPSCDSESDWRTKTGADTSEDYLGSTSFTRVPASNYAESEKSSELQLKWDQVKKEICNGSWKAIYTDDDAAFTAAVQDMTTQCQGYGYDDCKTWCETEAQTRFSKQED